MQVNGINQIWLCKVLQWIFVKIR